MHRFIKRKTAFILSLIFFTLIVINAANAGDMHVANAAQSVVRNEKFTTKEEMLQKIGQSDISNWSSLYLTEVENVYWTFATSDEYGTNSISENVMKNAYRSLEMLLDNGYLYSYNDLKEYAASYLQKTEGVKDGFYNILVSCLNNPYLVGKPEAKVTETTYNGRDYSSVFDADYYYKNNADLQAQIGYDKVALLKHFVEIGINEGRRGSESFDIESYIQTIDASILEKQKSSAVYEASDKSIEPTGRYSYSYACYYGLYLGHYSYVDEDTGNKIDSSITTSDVNTVSGTYVEDSLVSVYTGLPTTSELANTRPIAVMMPTDKAAQPSYGISKADILYEIMEEGGISRQMAIINDWQNLSRIGNLRSTRLYYTYASREWDAILVHFGGVFYLKGTIDAPDMNNLSGTYEYGTGGAAPGAGYFFRTSDRKAPHNAYISASGIIKASNKLGYSLNLRNGYYNNKHFTFADTTNTLSQYEGAEDATTIDLSKVFGYTKSKLVYDKSKGAYLKYIHGKVQTDGLDGTKLYFENVIVQNTRWQQMDKKGYLGFEMCDNTMDGYYFTKGKCIHINWVKNSAYEATVYYDDYGNEIELNPGKTYIAVAQYGKNVIY